MRLTTLFLLATLVATSASAASYQKIDGTIVDPIINHQYSEPHSYSWANLEPNADLIYAGLDHANLSYADLRNANLPYANLSYANLWSADLSNANLSRAYLYHADLSHANLNHADLSYAHLTGATFSFGTILFDEQTVAQHGFDAAGLQAKLEGDWGADNANNLTIIPEPSTLLLTLLALAAAPLRVRHG